MIAKLIKSIHFWKVYDNPKCIYWKNVITPHIHRYPWKLAYSFIVEISFQNFLIHQIYIGFSPLLPQKWNVVITSMTVHMVPYLDGMEFQCWTVYSKYTRFKIYVDVVVVGNTDTVCWFKLLHSSPCGDSTFQDMDRILVFFISYGFITLQQWTRKEFNTLFKYQKLRSNRINLQLVHYETSRFPKIYYWHKKFKQKANIVLNHDIENVNNSLYGSGILKITLFAYESLKSILYILFCS